MLEPTHSMGLDKEFIVQDEPEYLARIEVKHSLPFIHLDFKIWSPSSFKKLLKNWRLLRKCVRGPLYAISNDKDDEKWRKFVTRLGFEYFMNVDCPDGINRRCFISQDNADG